MDAYQNGQERRPVPTIHRLKTWPTYFRAVLSGAKSFEVRKMDRDFMLGDLLVLEEWDPTRKKYTGVNCVVEVTYILKGGQFGISDGYVVLGIKPGR